MFTKFLAIISFLSFSVNAAELTLENITESQFNGMTKEFGANFVHSAVTPPGSLGSIFGLEIGFVGGATSSPETDKVVKSVSSSSSAKNIPHGGLMAQVSVPYGLSIEGVIIPDTEVSSLSLSVLTIAAKWTLTESLITLPFVDIATRFHYGSSKLTSKTNSEVSSVPVDSKMEFDSSSWGTNLSVGLNLIFIKPYIGFGYVSTNTEIGVSATSGTIFDSSFSSAASAKKKHSGGHMFVGVELDLFLIHLGVEYSKIFDVEKYAAKFSLAF